MFKKNEEVNFFDLFINSGKNVCIASEKLLEFVKDYTNIEQKVNDIKELESVADEQAHTIYKELNKAFITPLEREDILELNYNIDNIIDGIEEVSSSFLMFDVKTLEPDVIQFVELVVKISKTLNDALVELKNFKKSKTLMNKIIEINTIEEEGDRLYAEAVKKLFSSAKDPVHIIKWNEIYKLLEDCLDDCEHVANTIEDVILKNS